MHYEIRRGLMSGKQLTAAQRTHGTFSEEPIVLGKVMRRGTKPRLISQAQFLQHRANLLRLLVSGSIEIFVVDGDKTPSKLDYRAARALGCVEAAPVGDVAPSPASPEEEQREELEVRVPPSSTKGGTVVQTEESDEETSEEP